MEQINNYIPIIYFCIGTVFFCNMLVVWIHKEIYRDIRISLSYLLFGIGFVFFNAGGKALTDYQNDGLTFSTMIGSIALLGICTYFVYTVLQYFNKKKKEDESSNSNRSR